MRWPHPSAAVEFYKDRLIPAGRLGTPGDVAGAFAFLASDDALFVRGRAGRSGSGTQRLCPLARLRLHVLLLLPLPPRPQITGHTLVLDGGQTCGDGRKLHAWPLPAPVAAAAAPAAAPAP